MQKRRSFLSKLGIGGLALGTLNMVELSAKDSTSHKSKRLVHQVYFWLKKDLTQAQKDTFDKGVKSLLRIKTICYGDVGTPAATPDRPVIDKSYDYALLVVFDDVAGHDAYQVDPIHEKFLKDCKDLWDKVVVYDAASA